MSLREQEEQESRSRNSLVSDRNSSDVIYSILVECFDQPILLLSAIERRSMMSFSKFEAGKKFLRNSLDGSVVSDISSEPYCHIDLGILNRLKDEF